MPVCAVFGCKTNHKNIQGTGMKFYSFPRDPVYEKLWISACKRSDALPKKPRICSLHFKEDSYHKPLIQTLLNYTPVTSRNLKPDAIPTENMPDESTLPGCKKSKRDSKTNKNLENNKLFFTAVEPKISVRSGVFLKSEMKNYPSIVTESIQDDTTFNAADDDVQDTTLLLLDPLCTTSDTQVNGTMPEVKSLTNIEAQWRTEVGILCRLCTKSNYGCIPIFKGQGEKLELEMKIMKYLHIQVEPGDELPDHVCPVCLEAVLAWHEFAESCSNFDKQLKKLLSVNDKKNGNIQINLVSDRETVCKKEVDEDDERKNGKELLQECSRKRKLENHEDNVKNTKRRAYRNSCVNIKIKLAEAARTAEKVMVQSGTSYKLHPDRPISKTQIADLKQKCTQMLAKKKIKRSSTKRKNKLSNTALEERRRKGRERNRKYLARLSKEQLEKKLEKERQYKRFKRATMTERERKIYRKLVRERVRKHREKKKQLKNENCSIQGSNANNESTYGGSRKNSSRKNKQFN